MGFEWNWLWNILKIWLEGNFFVNELSKKGAWDNWGLSLGSFVTNYNLWVRVRMLCQRVTGISKFSFSSIFSANNKIKCIEVTQKLCINFSSANFLLNDKISKWIRAKKYIKSIRPTKDESFFYIFQKSHINYENILYYGGDRFFGVLPLAKNI